jgi:signal transduction histidine kinase
MIFSKRLDRVPAHLFFIAFSLFTLVFLEAVTRAVPLVAVSVWIMGVVFILNGTLGWRYVQRSQSPRYVTTYFVLQTVWWMLTMLVEVQTAQYGPTTAALAAPLIVQVSVLSRRWRSLSVLAWAIIASLFTIRTIPELERILPIFLSFGILFGFMSIIGTLIVGEERAQQKSRQLAEYAAQAEELATLRERNRLARDIHDNLGHYLTVVNMQIEAALALLDTDPIRTRETLLKAQGLTKDGLTEIRRSITALRASPIENRALHEAIQLLVDEHHGAGYAVEFAVQGTILRASEAVEMTLYRVVQEGLTNIRKHAHAKHTDVMLDYRADNLISLSVQDDGLGSAKDDGGFGLLGIRERVQLLNGQLTVHSKQGQGFRLQVEIPI